MNDTCTVRQCYVIVARDVMTLFLRLSVQREEGLILSVLKVFTFESLQHCTLTEHRIGERFSKKILFVSALHQYIIVFRADMPRLWV